MLYIPYPFKRCSKCGNDLLPSISCFLNDKRGYYWLTAECRECHKSRNNIYRASNTNEIRRKGREYQQSLPKELKRQIQKDWRKNNPEKAHNHDNRSHNKRRQQEREYARKRYWSDPDRFRQEAIEYNRVHPEKNSERKKRFRAAYPELAKQRERAAYQRRRLKAIEYARQWRESHPGIANYYRRQKPDVYRANLLRYRAKKRSLPNTFTAQDWRRCLAYFDNRCAVCGRPVGLWHTLAMDHWIPLIDPRPDNPGTVPENILPLCHGVDGCNNKKNKHDPEQWLVEYLGKRKAKQKLTEINEYFEWVKTNR